MSIDEQSDARTKVYADKELHVLWNKDDRISIFSKKAFNREYRFDGEDGANAGAILPEGTDGDGDPLYLVYAVYPYIKSNSIDASGTILFDIPEIQYYHTGSFGIGANTMVSSTDDNKLKFKNVGGYLALQLYGTNVSVSSIIIRGNNNESLAGKCKISMAGGIPSVTWEMEDISKRIQLFCNTPVELDSEKSTVFWIVLPPLEFSNGFNITVNTPDGGVFKKSTSNQISIKRSAITRLSTLEVIAEPAGQFGINSISSNRGGLSYEADYDVNTRTFTLTIPTATDFSGVLLDYEMDGDLLLVDGQEVVGGVTPVDVSEPVSLTVCRGDAEQRYTLVARNTGLPVVRIETPGHALDEITKEEWMEEAVLRIENPDGVIDCEGMMSIKGRGNFTWGFNKKPYTLKLNEKHKVLGMPSHKRWVLLANWTDRTLLRNDAAFWLSRHAGLDYTVSGQFVELEFNGVHRGNYYLCEQIKIGKKRVNITEMDEFETDSQKITGGFLMEIDSYFDEPRKFHSVYFKLPYQFKQPDEDDLSDEAFEYMQSFINNLELLLLDSERVNKHEYEEYMDVDSFIWYMLLNELTNNADFYSSWPADGPHSMYVYKDRDDENGEVGKLFAGPVWDFDYHTFIPNFQKRWIGADKINFYYNFLYQDTKFCERILELWDSKKDELRKLTDYIDEMADKIRLSERYNHELWPIPANQNLNGDGQMTFDEAVTRIKEGFTKRLKWIDLRLRLLHYSPR